MTEFDIFVRRFLLASPNTLHSRADVVLQVWLGNGGGLHWNEGRLAFLSAKAAAHYGNEEQNRATYLDSIKVWEDIVAGSKALMAVEDPKTAEMAKQNYETYADKVPDRAEWQDRLDRIDEVALFVDPEAGIEMSGASGLVRPVMIEEAGIWFALDVPDDVEDSFLGGAIEALDMVHRSLPDMEVDDRLVETVAYIESERTRLHQMRADRAAALGAATGELKSV